MYPDGHPAGETFHPRRSEQARVIHLPRWGIQPYAHARQRLAGLLHGHPAGHGPRRSQKQLNIGLTGMVIPRPEVVLPSGYWARPGRLTARLARPSAGKSNAEPAVRPGPGGKTSARRRAGNEVLLCRLGKRIPNHGFGHPHFRPDHRLVPLIQHHARQEGGRGKHQRVGGTAQDEIPQFPSRGGTHLAYHHEGGIGRGGKSESAPGVSYCGLLKLRIPWYSAIPAPGKSRLIKVRPDPRHRPPRFIRPPCRCIARARPPPPRRDPRPKTPTPEPGPFARFFS